MDTKIYPNSRKLAWTFFATCMGLFVLQILYGFLMAFQHMGWDGFHEIIPFNAARATHLNLLVVWMLGGFMGAAYYIIPEEADNDVWQPKLAWAQWGSLVVVAVTAVIGFHFGWWEGRKFLEIPRPLDYLVVVNVLLFLLIIGKTLFGGKRFTTTSVVLMIGLTSTALLYLPGMIFFSNHSLDSYFRWWVVHLWVEGVWELTMGSILAYLLIKLTGVDREIIEKWLYIIVGLTFLSGILGTGHHYYYIGAPGYWLAVGGIFSALEPLAFLGMALYTVAIARKRGMEHPNQIALKWTVGTGIMSFVGAGFLGFAHTVPQVNQWTHGTLVTAMHGHLAFWGAYGMLILAMITYAMPQMTGRKLFAGARAELAFWTTNIGMISMTGAFGVAGIAQVYLERKGGMDFMEVQREVQPHFIALALAATVFLAGVTMFVWDFVKYGPPVFGDDLDVIEPDPDSGSDDSVAKEPAMA